MSSDYNIYELLELLSKDNLEVTINSNDAAERLCLSLSWLLKEIDEDGSIVPSFLSKGILYLIKFFQQFFSQLSSTCEFSPHIFTSFEDILDILNSIADTGIQTKCTVVLQFGEDLICYVNKHLLPFHFRLKIVKYTNLLFERCPTYVKDCLYAKASYKKNLRNALKLISSIGDYEFQVGIIECVFRAISKQKRAEALNALCPPAILSSVLAIKDEHFEADCRRVLNTFNSQQGAHQRVFSIPCIDITLGNLQLQKPKDDNYKEFWIDFNTTSKRISFYCSQIVDNEDPQETDEDIWETVCILKDYVQEISSNDDDDILTVQFTFLPLSLELIPGFTLEKSSFIKILFKDKDAVMKAIQEIFCSQKCSIAKNQICIKKKKKSSFLPKILLPSVDAEEEDLDRDTVQSIVSSQYSASRSVRKSSVPSEIMSSQHSNDGRYCEVSAIRVCRQFPSPETLNRSQILKKPAPTQMSRVKVNNEAVKQKQNKIYKNRSQKHDKKEQKQEPVSSPSTITSGQTHNQFKETKNKNSDPTKFESLYIPCSSNLDELKKLNITNNKKSQSIQIRKQTHSERSSINVFIYSSAEEEINEDIPPTFETKSPFQSSIQNKSTTNSSIYACETLSYKQNKIQPITKDSDITYLNITPHEDSNEIQSKKPSPVEKQKCDNIVKENSNHTKSKKPSPVEKQKCDNIVKENLTKKDKIKSPQKSNMAPQEKEEKFPNKTEFGNVSISARPNDLKKLSEGLAPSTKCTTSSNNECSITNKESSSVSKTDMSFVSHSLSIKKTNSDENISSKINNSETKTTTSRKGRRLRSFEALDLLPQNYPLPKDGKPSTETSKKINPSKKKNTSTHNIITKHMEEDKVVCIKETQPESTKADEVTLIPDSLPMQNNRNKPEIQPKPKQTGPAKSKKILAVDSGISSSNNSPACMNDLPSTTMKKRCSYSSPPQPIQKDFTSTKQTICQMSTKHADVVDDTTRGQSTSDKKSLPKTNSFHNDKINTDTGKAVKTLDSKQNKDNKQNISSKSISKAKEEFCYQFPSHESSPLKTQSQVSCYAPITQDNLSKFNKEGQKNLAKELDERIEEFVKASCQNISETSPFADSPAENRNKIQSVSLKRTNRQTTQDFPCDQSNGNKTDQHFVENNPLPSNSSKALLTSPSVVTNMEEQQLKDASQMKEKIPNEQKANDDDKVLYQAIKLGPVSALSNDPTLFITNSKQEQSNYFIFSPVKKDQTLAPSQKRQLLTNRSKSLDSAKPSMGGKENKNSTKILSSPTEKLFKVSPPKRRSLNLPLKRDRAAAAAAAAAKVYEKKKGYDPYDFDSGSSIEENFQPAATCSKLSTPTRKKQKSIHCQNSVHSAPQLQSPKGNKKLEEKQPKASPEDSYKFEKEIKQNSPNYPFDPDYKSPQPKKRSKAKMNKSKFTTNISPSSIDLRKINPGRISVRKRKDIDYKEISSVESSISSFSEPGYENKPKKKKNPPVNQSTNILPNNSVNNLFDQEDQIKETAESTCNTSHTQQSEISWINPKKSNSPKIQVEKTYAIKKQTSYYGSFACIPKRKHNDNKTRNHTKITKDPFTKELSPKRIRNNASPELNGKADHDISPKSVGTYSPKHPKNIYSFSHDKAKSSLSSDWQMNKKTKKKKTCMKEPFFPDSIEIQRADSFVMFPEDSKLNISKAELILQENSSHPVSSISNKSNVSDLEITFSSAEDPKLLLATLGADGSIQSLKDDPIINDDSKLMLTPSPYLTIDDLKSSSDRPEQDINEPNKNQLFKATNLEDISHSTPVKELSPLLYTGGNYKSKAGFRKSLFSDPKSDSSEESQKSSLLSPIATNRLIRRSLKKVDYNAKLDFCSSLSISDKSMNTTSSDDSSHDSSHEESSRNDIGSYDFPVQSGKSFHFQKAPSMAYIDDDDNIKNIVQSFSEDMKKSIQTKHYEMSTAIEDVLKSTQKSLNKICEKDVLKRSDVHNEFDQKFQQAMDELETSTMAYEEQKKKALNYFQEQIKEMQKLKDVQQKSLKKLKMINSLHHQTMSFDGNSNKVQHHVQSVMKNQMHRLQNKLLDQARLQEMQQVKNQLRKMLL